MKAWRLIAAAMAGATALTLLLLRRRSGGLRYD
jgi:hypothetical protein